ncbi:hypothetical protein ROZALSC1DRAFT_29005 [Rozella allomycis CSF55]|uniref:Uncharacterized protein n=1 Tax=Rozella allomycis (strain CSF55) TaxID=988480 RepID=A0A075AZI1_ROZAC|nr:hypothetical protein O9G_002660 [Rozella allomycis CSF55]RKP19385.1 hypothetical protein ROZALSC1DRAFT_29005 [Rozella allomycis CSF55]|eukprot:EPZ35652.1 hypothetical protein O9G_002660 [Rozella allomycis CSF55]
MVKPTFTQGCFYLINSCVLSALPLCKRDLFTEIKGFTFAENQLVLGIPLLLMALAMPVAIGEQLKANKSSDTAELPIYEKMALAYSVFFNNVMFLGVFLFVTGGLFSKAGEQAEIVLSIIIPVLTMIYLTSPARQ